MTVLLLTLLGTSPGRAAREWYVMVPPAATGPTDERWREDGLAQWERWAVAGSAAECHQMVTALRALAGTAGHEPETPVPDWARDTPWIQSVNARCIASDDPRLER